MGAPDVSSLSSFSLELRPAPLPVVGRSAEQLLITRALEDVPTGGLRAVILEGEPGIGKTRLLEATAELLVSREFVVLSAVTDEELQGPFLLARSLFGSEPARRLATESGAGDELDRLLDGLAGRPDPGLDGLPEDQKLLRLYDLAALAVRAFTAQVPLALLLDDLHWADHDSIRMLRYIVRSEGGSPLFLMLALRPEESAFSEVATLIADMERLRVARRVRLDRITETDTGGLLALVLEAQAAPATISTIHSQAEGVPFMIEELARAYRDAGLLQRIEGRWELAEKAERLLPGSVEMLIRRRANHLPEATREALSEGAILGRAFGVGDLAALRDQLGKDGDADSLAEALAPAVAAGLLQELPEGQAADYRFAHEQIRSFAQASLSRAGRRAIHAAIVDLLAADGEPAPEAMSMLAYHSLAAGFADRCAKYSVEAARLAREAHAPDEVLRLVDMALESAINPRDRVELLRLRDDALEMLHRSAERLAALPQLASLVEAMGDPALEIDVTLRRAAALRLSGDEERAAELADRARERAAGDGDRRSELSALLELGQALLRSPIGESQGAPPAGEVDLDGTERAYREALAAAEELDDAASVAAVRRELGVIGLGRARVAFNEWVEMPDRPAPFEHPPLMEQVTAAMELFQEALDGFEKLGDRRGMMATLIAMAYAGWGLDIRFGSARRIEDLRRLIARSKALTRESERELQEAQMLYGVHLFGRAFGFFDMALTRGEEAYRAARGIGDRGLEFVVSGGMAQVHLLMNELEQVREWLGRAATASVGVPTPFRARTLEMWRGMVEAASGDGRAMREHLEGALAMAGEHGKPAARCELLARMSLEAALLATGPDGPDDLLEPAREWAEQGRTLAGALAGDHPWTSQVEAALALVAASRGDSEGAAAAVDASLDALEALSLHEGDPPYPLHIDVLVACVRAVRGSEDETARRARTLARRMLNAIGERIMDEDVRVRWFRAPRVRELADLSAGEEAPVAGMPERPTLPVDVTEREREILGMVVLGRTNREIAEELGVEEMEVVRDLSGVYAKLGVSTRAGATAMTLIGGLA